MSSGLIYAVIVALWAVVLVPVWLRRHDEVSEARSVDRFQGAMRTLSRRAVGTGDRREVLVPRRPRDRAVPDGAAPQLSAAARATARRRRTGLVLIVFTVLVAALGAMKVLPWWAAAVPAVILVLFVFQGRRSTRRARERALAVRRANAARARRARMAMVEAGAASDGVYDDRAAAESRASREERRAGDLAIIEADLAATRAATAAAAATLAQPDDSEFYDAVAARVWEPVPVPLPTYVSAPKARRAVRVIDLNLPGAWTSGHLEGDTAATEAAASTGLSVEPPETADADGIVTGQVLVERRAVGD